MTTLACFCSSAKNRVELTGTNSVKVCCPAYSVLNSNNVCVCEGAKGNTPAYVEATNTGEGLICIPTNPINSIVITS